MAAATVHDIKLPSQTPAATFGVKAITREELDRHVILLKEYTREIDEILLRTVTNQGITSTLDSHHINVFHIKSLNQKQRNLEKIIRKVSQYNEHGAMRFTDAFEVELRLAEAEVVLFASQKVSDYTKAA